MQTVGDALVAAQELSRLHSKITKSQTNAHQSLECIQSSDFPAEKTTLAVVHTFRRVRIAAIADAMCMSWRMLKCVRVSTMWRKHVYVHVAINARVLRERNERSSRKARRKENAQEKVRMQFRRAIESHTRDFTQRLHSFGQKITQHSSMKRSLL